MTRGRDGGSAIVEFVGLAVLLLVPLCYVVLAAFTVQNAAFAVTGAAREAGRAYVTAAAGDPQTRAEGAAALTLRDHGLGLPPGGLRISCEAADCTAPGTALHVALDYPVLLPLLPRTFAGHPVGGIVVHARHTEIVDVFRAP